MSLSLQQLRDGLRKALGGLDSLDLTDTDADLLLNTSWWEVADIFEFKEKETIRTYPTVIGTKSYATAADLNGIRQVSIEDLNSNQHTLLSPMTTLLYESDFINNVNSRGKPTNYIPYGANVILYPTPDKVYTITEYYDKTLADIAAGGVTIPQAWHEIIKYGAIYRGFVDFGDYNRSRAAKVMQQELLATKELVTTKEKQDLPYAGIRVLRPRYP